MPAAHRLSRSTRGHGSTPRKCTQAATPRSMQHTTTPTPPPPHPRHAACSTLTPAATQQPRHATCSTPPPPQHTTTLAATPPAAHAPMQPCHAACSTPPPPSPPSSNNLLCGKQIVVLLWEPCCSGFGSLVSFRLCICSESGRTR